MGNGGSSQPSKPKPPPVPTISYDPAATAAEIALADQVKASYAVTTESEDEKARKAKLGEAPINRTPGTSAATTVTRAPSGNMGSSAVLTG